MPISRRPTIVFGEQHTDPIKDRIQIKLIPHLQALGINCYYDESPSGFCMGDTTASMTLPQYLEKLKEKTPVVEQLMTKLFSQLKKPPSLVNLSLHEKFELVIRFLISINDQVKQNNLQFDEHLKQTVDREQLEHYFAESEKLLYCGLKLKNMQEDLISISKFLSNIVLGKVILANQFSYEGIDDSNRLEFHKDQDIDSDDNRELIEKTFNQRNITLAAALVSKPPGFGSFGLNHIAPIQTEILKSLSKVEASQRFLFFYIDSVLDINDPIKQADYPLGIEVLDTKYLSDEEIIETIVKRIKSLELSQCASQGYQANNMFNTDETFITQNQPEIPKVTMWSYPVTSFV